MVKLIKANIRKDKAVLLIFLLIVILSVLLMHTGLMVSDYKKLYREKSEETSLQQNRIYQQIRGLNVQTISKVISAPT